MEAVKWTGFLGSSLGKLFAEKVSALDLHTFKTEFFASKEFENVPLDLTAVTGSALAREVGQGACGEDISIIAQEIDFFFFCLSCVSKFRLGAGEAAYLSDHEPWRGASNFR
jgi:hypothetical protein